MDDPVKNTDTLGALKRVVLLYPDRDAMVLAAMDALEGEYATDRRDSRRHPRGTGPKGHTATGTPFALE